MRTGASLDFAGGLCIALLAACLAPAQARAADDAAQEHKPKLANFARERASLEARHVADWVVDSGDNHDVPFVIVDKKDARIFVFDAHGKLQGAAPALLGLAKGDDAIPGIGDREMSTIRPAERTTPAGRFVAAIDRFRVLWVDYGTSVSIHRVINTKPAERRPQRLASPTPLDNRISYGCINVPIKFYDKVVLPAFAGPNAIVYVLPDTKSVKSVFASYDVAEHARHPR
jgi:hypothetical protein